MTQYSVSPPASEKELMARCEALAGRSLGELAHQLGLPIPANLKRSKGWVGQLLEQCLGTTASTLPVPDFTGLGIELKTLPVDGEGQVRESTYVCTVPLSHNHGLSWETSWVRQKLARVLWVPVEANPEQPLAARRVGSAILWRPSAEQARQLREDWEELMDMVCLGHLEQITSHHGRVLQIRPKAANASALTPGSDSEGNPIMTLPRGFYLRSRFTQQILQQHYILPV